MMKSMEKLSGDNLYQQMLHILKRENILELPNEDKWKHFYGLIEKWKEKYLISYEFINPFSIEAYYFQIHVGKFRISGNDAGNIDDNIIKMMLVLYFLESYKDYLMPLIELEEWLGNTFHYVKERGASLSKNQMLDELNDIYERSEKVFIHERERRIAENDMVWIQKCVEKTQKIYQKFRNVIEEFGDMKDAWFIRPNQFQTDTEGWYIAVEKSGSQTGSVHMISVILMEDYL